MPDAPPEAAGHLRALDAVLARLRDRGYPAPRLHAVGHVPGLMYWVQQRLPGSPLDRGPGGPDGAALARLLTELLALNDAQADLGTGPRRWRSLLTRGPRLRPGDLAVYHYDHDDIRDVLRARLLNLAGPEAACAYLAHMVLRQVDWSLRHHPAAAATRRHLRLANVITADIDRTLPG